MEKFGIFELLDALSAAMEGDTEQKTAPPSSPSTEDKAFAPPAYGEEQRANPALSLLLERHEALKKKAKK